MIEGFLCKHLQNICGNCRRKCAIMMLCGFVIYPVDSHEEPARRRRVEKRAGKRLVSKVTKLHENFDLVLFTGSLIKIVSSKLKSLKP